MLQKPSIFKLLTVGTILVMLATQLPPLQCNSTLSSQDTPQQLDAYLHTLTKLNRFSGSVVVAKGDTVLLNKGYGLANHQFEIPNGPQTKFMICSITKMVTAAAILQLQEKKLLNVNDQLSKYIPDFPRGNDITIHHLLTHTAGLTSSNLPLEMVVHPASLEAMITFFKSKPLGYEPGCGYEYSNAGYYLLSLIIEKASGCNYESYIKHNILDPLGMYDSTFGDHDYAIIKNGASGYCFNEANQIVNGHYVYSNFRGGGGLWCTAHDLYKFALALNTGKIINKDSLQSMFTPYSIQDNYGYGCNVGRVLGHTCIEHGGMLSSGYKSNLSMFVENDMYIVILSNCFSAWHIDARNALAAIVFEQPYDVPSCDEIAIDPAVYDDYVGTYDHPDFPAGYTVEKRNSTVCLPNGIELIPVAPNQFISSKRNADNIVYLFIRDETGCVNQLRIKGGGLYHEVRCDKIK